MTSKVRMVLWSVVALLGVALAAPVCNAGGLILTGYTGNVMVNVNGGTANSAFHNIEVGGFVWQGGASPLSMTFTAFCIDVSGPTLTPSPTQPYAYNAPTSAPPSPMSAASAAAIAKLWGGYYSQVNSPVSYAAFQLAIWNLEYNVDATPQHNPTGASFSSPSSPFQANAPVGSDGAAAIALATTLVAETLNGTFDSAAPANLVFLTSMFPGSAQNQVTATPEPSTLCLGAIGVGMLFTAGVRRRRKVAAVTT